MKYRWMDGPELIICCCTAYLRKSFGSWQFLAFFYWTVTSLALVAAFAQRQLQHLKPLPPFLFRIRIQIVRMVWISFAISRANSISNFRVFRSFPSHFSKTSENVVSSIDCHGDVVRQGEEKTFAPSSAKMDATSKTRGYDEDARCGASIRRRWRL